MTPGFYFDHDRRPVDWDSVSSVVLANPEWLRREGTDARAIERQLPALDGHVWVATSGTSGSTAGAVRWIGLSKHAFLVSARAVNQHLSASSSDVWAHALPIFHVGGLGILARAHVSGARVVAAIEGRWDAALFAATVASSGATLTALVPPQVHDLVQARLPAPPSLRAIVVGGARLDAALYRSARDLGWACLPSYGLTETCSQVATASIGSLSRDEYPGALPVLAHAEIRADEDQRLSIRAESLLTCAAEIAEGHVRVWDPKRDGWLETDDLGRASGRTVEVLGRVAESVKVLGEMVSLTRVEEQARIWAGQEGLQALIGFDLAVVALPHARLGHELVLAIAGAVPPDRRATIESSLASFCRAALLPYERIQRIAWAARLPRTPLGKLQRAALTADLSSL